MKEKKKKKSDYRGACKWSISLFISRAFSIFEFLFRPHSERERTLQTKNLQILGLLKLSLISLFSFPFLPIHHTMGANSMLTESTHDLDEQISQLMQCKPLSEQQVSFNFPHLLRSASLLTKFATKMSISLIFYLFALCRIQYECFKWIICETTVDFSIWSLRCVCFSFFW